MSKNDREIIILLIALVAVLVLIGLVIELLLFAVVFVACDFSVPLGLSWTNLTVLATAITIFEFTYWIWDTERKMI